MLTAQAVIILAVIVIAWALGAPARLAFVAVGALGIWMAVAAIRERAPGRKPATSAPREHAPLDFVWKPPQAPPQYAGELAREVEFYRRVAPGARRIVDATENVGQTAAALVHSFPRARIAVLERDPDVLWTLEDWLAGLDSGARVVALAAPDGPLPALARAGGDFDLVVVRCAHRAQELDIINRVAAPVVIQVPHGSDLRKLSSRLRGRITAVSLGVPGPSTPDLVAVG